MAAHTLWVGLRDVRIHAPVGVYAEERLLGNDFSVSLEVNYPSLASLEKDELEHALDYTLLLEAIEHGFAQEAQLLEFVAGKILRLLGPKLSGMQYRLHIEKLAPYQGRATMAASSIKLEGVL